MKLETEKCKIRVAMPEPFLLFCCCCCCFTVISLINVDISSHISINSVIKALYGFTEGEEHLNKRGVKVDSDHSGSVLVLGRSHPVGLVCFHCSL